VKTQRPKISKNNGYECHTVYNEQISQKAKKTLGGLKAEKNHRIVLANSYVIARNGGLGLDFMEGGLIGNYFLISIEQFLSMWKYGRLHRHLILSYQIDSQNRSLSIQPTIELVFLIRVSATLVFNCLLQQYNSLASSCFPRPHRRNTYSNSNHRVFHLCPAIGYPEFSSRKYRNGCKKLLL